VKEERKGDTAHTIVDITTCLAFAYQNRHVVVFHPLELELFPFISLVIIVNFNDFIWEGNLPRCRATWALCRH